jgi:hypothetical protein
MAAKASNKTKANNDEENGIRDSYPERLSITACREILPDKTLTDQQVLSIRDFLYTMAGIEYSQYHRR